MSQTLKNKKQAIGIGNISSTYTPKENLIPGNLSNSVSCGPDNRLQVIEQNLSRVCLQQDALMPLLNCVELLPQLQKFEGTIKNLQRKMEDCDQKQQKQEKAIEKRFTDLSSKDRVQKTNADPKFAKQIEDIQSVVKDLENSFNNVYRWYEAKLKEESYIIQRSVDQKLEKNKAELQTTLQDVKNNKSIVLSDNQPGSLNIKEEILNSVRDVVDQRIKEIVVPCLDEVKQSFEQELRNVYKELGCIKSEVEFIVNYERKIKIGQKVQKLPKELETLEKKVKINLLEQECFIDDLETFNKENTQRIVFEADSIEKDCDSIANWVANYQQQGDKETLEVKLKELNFLMEKQINLKYQVAGTKKKYALDMQKIEEKFEILSQIRNESQEKFKKNPQLQGDADKTGLLEDKLKKLMQTINSNLENLNKTLQDLENKILDTRYNSESILSNQEQLNYQ